MDRPARDGDASAAAVGDGSEPLTVLHVDPEPAVGETVAGSLERADDRIEVRTATSMEGGFERLDDGIDCVVSGHDPPDTDGIELLRAVRESHGDLPFLLFTDGTREELAGEAISAGVTDYLPIRTAPDGCDLLAERVLETVIDDRSRRVRRVTAEGGTAIGERAKTEEGRRERALASLHDATRELMRAESEVGIADLAVRTARDILGMPITGCWLYDEHARVLSPVASTPEADALVGEPPTYHEGEGLSWEAFEAAETRVYADVSTQPERYNPETVVRSEIVLPLGEYGVLNVGSTEVDAFDDADVSLARVLAANTEAALTRADREEQLRSQRDLVDASIDALDDVFCVFDADGRMVRWNDRVAEATGYTAEELEGKRLPACLAPEDRDRVASATRELHRTGRARLEADLLTSDDERIPYEFTASALAGTTEAASGFVAVGRDVTERRERLLDLERYEGIVEASGDPVYTLDADGRFTFVNDALLEMVGHDEETLLGSHVSVVMAPEDISRTRNVIRSLLASGDDRETVEMPIVTADGERIPCEAHITVLPFEGAFRGTVGVVRDVSERLEHVRKLEALQRRTQDLMHTRTAVETARLAVDTAEEVLGVPLAGIHLLGDDGEVLEPVATLDRVREAFDEPPTYERASDAPTDEVVWDVFEAGEPLVIEDTHTHERDRLAEVTPARNVVIHPLDDHGILVVSSTEPGTFDGTDTVLVEILATALRAALDRVGREAQLERQNERLEEFANVVSHDLRNPLNVAMGSLDIAREECETEHHDAVANAHDRMEALIADLLTLAREGEDDAEKEPVVLAEAVEECWRNVETSDATLRLETDRLVLADGNRLRQLLENLLGNAVEHGGAGVEGGVTVTVEELADGFYVEDDGSGVPEDERDRVFEVGYSTSDEGTGFGLKIVADVARQQGWDVDVVEGADGGARFEVTGVEFDRA